MTITVFYDIIISIKTFIKRGDIKVNEFKVINIMNEAMLRMLKDKNCNYEKNIKIKEYLKDEAFFFKINRLDAFKILQYVGVKQEQLENVYNKLISPNVFYDLVNSGKIKANDEEVIIKYDIYNSDNLFKKKN